MKNTYQKGAVGVVAIILILLAGAVGFYFYNAGQTDKSAPVTEPMDINEPVGFEENPENLPNPNIPVVTEELIIAANVGMKGFTFAPATVTIKAGQSVEWVNDDSANHTVTADDGSFDSGNEAPGNSYSRKFDKAGTYTYFCKWHPNMKGTVIVTE